MVRFTIQYPNTKEGRKDWAKRYGLNAIYSGKHWAARKADSQYWHTMVCGELKKQRIPQKLFSKPVHITFYWHDNLDIDNHAYMGKMIVDAIKGRLIQDDSKKYLTGVEHRFHGRDCILVEIEEE